LGTVFSNQVAVGSTEEVQKWLKKNRIKSYAATPHAKKLYNEVKYGAKAAIIIGTEHEGLSKNWQEFVDEKIRIPMKGKIDSLNASVSTAIVVFEIMRQRAGLT
jgi:TrmH family RNA methyltransferase